MIWIPIIAIVFPIILNITCVVVHDAFDIFRD